MAVSTFTELGFGTAPLGNLYRAVSDDEAQADPGGGLGRRLPLLRHRAALRARPRPKRGSTTSCAARRATTMCCRPRSAACCDVCPPEQRTGIGKFFDTPSRREVYDYSHDGVMRSFEASLERLGVDRIDILFVHDLDIFTHGSQEASDAAHRGVHALGLLRPAVAARPGRRSRRSAPASTNGRPAQTLAERGDFDLFLLAGRYTLLEQEALESFLPLCEKRGIGIVLGGPYNSGILATGPKPGAFYNYSEAPQEILDRVARIEAVCERHGVRLIEAALQFPLLHPSVVSVIPGGQSVEQVAATAPSSTPTFPPQLWSDLKAEGLMREDAPIG